MKISALFLFSLLFLTGCSNEQQSINNLSNLDGGRVFAVAAGTAADQMVLQRFPDAKLIYFNNVLHCALAVKEGKADATAYDLPVLVNIAAKIDGLRVLDELIMKDQYGFAVRKDDTALKEIMDQVLSDIQSDGTYEAMSARWFPRAGTPGPMPDIPENGSGGELVFGTAAVTEPMSFVGENQQVIGFDIEFATRIAAKAGKKLNIVNMEFGAMLPALISGKVDMIGAGLSITEERAKSVLFSEPYYRGGLAVIVKGQENTVAHKPFFRSIGDSVRDNLIVEGRYKLVLDGLLVTIIITILAALLGTILGGGVCFLNMSHNKMSRKIAEIYIGFFRGTPVLVLLLIIYYVVFASVTVTPVIVAIIAFGLNFAAYVSEIYRTAIESVNKGQWEAGKAGGFTNIQTFRHIILPQAIRHALPVYKGEFISMMKATSVVGYIAVQDITRVSDIIRSRTFDAFFPLLLAAAIYLVLAWLLTRLLNKVEISVVPERKRLQK